MDEAEFDGYYAASFPRLSRQLYAMTGDADEAAECVQEAFVRAWAQRRRFAHVDHPDAWIRTTAYRLAVSRWRRLTRGRRDPDRAIGPPLTGAAPSETHVALVTALKQLPEAQRQALVLHHLADLPVREVAVETGVPTGTVKARLSRGRAALAALLDDGIVEGAHHA